MALALIPSTLLVVATGLVIAYRLPLQGAGERIAAAMTLMFATLTAELLFAGAVLGTLDALVVGALAAAGFIVSLLAAGIRRPDAYRRIAAMALGDAVRAIWVARQSRLLLILSIGLAAGLAWHLLLALRLPVVDWDGLAYHLVTVDVWLQTGHIGRVPQLLWSDGYPANGELVTTWLMVFGHSDAFADLTGLVALPLGMTAIATFARRLGADRVPAALTALVIVAMPAVVLKASSTYVDNIGMANIAAAWAFGVGALQKGDPKRQVVLAVLTGVSIGLAIGTKASLIPSAALIGLAVVVVVVRSLWSRSARLAVLAVVATSMPVLVFGAAWYVKNLIVFGNPLWPIKVGSLPGVGTAAELIAKAPPEIAGLAPLAQIATSWTKDFFLTTYSEDVRIGGFGVAWLPLLVLAAIGAALHVRQHGWLILALLAVPTAATLALMPGPWWPRYTLFLAVLAAGFAALALSRGPKAVRVIGVPLLAALALWSLVTANRTGNFQLHPGGPYRPSVVAMVNLLRANESQRRHISHWDECQAFDALPDGVRVRTDGFLFPHLIIGSQLGRQFLMPFGPDVSPRAAIDLDGEVATHLVISDPGHIAAARADPATFTPLGSACRGAEMFAVNANR